MDEQTPTPEQRRELNAYEKICAEKCRWCAKGNEPSVHSGTVHKIYPMTSSGGFQDPSIKGPLSEYFKCTAPSKDTVISGLVREVERLREGIEAGLKALDDARIGEAGLVLMEAIGKGSNAKT